MESHYPSHVGQVNSDWQEVLIITDSEYQTAKKHKLTFRPLVTEKVLNHSRQITLSKTV